MTLDWIFPCEDIEVGPDDETAPEEEACLM
jgi:hypothetical protein